MRSSLLTGIALLALLLPARADAQAAAKDTRPNIVLIMADDMGFSDLGCYGSEIATPNLDRLAADGLRFRQFYNGARCCPTRAALMTGLYAHQAGVGHMVEHRDPPGYQGFLNDRCVTIAEALGQGGYRTFMAGKWHVGEERPHWPVDRGYEHFYGLVSGGSNYFRLDAGRIMARDGERCEPEGDHFYMTDAFTDAAVSYVADGAKSGRPFFLYLAYTSPHWPLHAWPEDIAKYRGKYRQGWDALREERHARQIKMGLVDARWALTPRDEEAPAWADVPESKRDDLDLRMAVYAAQIDRMDQNIGRVLAALKTAGVEQNTLIMFISDNGGCAEVIDRGIKGVPAGDKDSFLSYGLPWANASNTPFRRFKHWTHEGGISTPFIVHWPAGLKTHGFTDQVGHITDVMATCLDVAGVPYPKEYKGHEITPLEGRSLKPIFATGQRPPRESICWEHEGNRAVRQGQWKLVSRFPGQWELYDLVADRTELHDVKDQQPERVQAMIAEYDKWAQRVGVVPWGQLTGRNKQAAQSAGPQPETGANGLPNFVIIFMDDMGYADIGPFGAKGYATPNLDRLAQEGRVFTDFYAGQPVCSASRACLMTGCYNVRLGILGALGPRAEIGLNRQEMTLAQLCKQKGYATACFGKWHLGHHPKFLPTARGFDEYFGLPYSNDMWPFHPETMDQPLEERLKRWPYLPLIENDEIINPNVSDADQNMLTTWYTEHAVSFIDRNKDRPFLLYVPQSMVHVPLHVSDKFRSKSERGLFGDAVMEIDWSVGEIVGAIRRNGLEKKTLVLFTSDNGPWLVYGTHAGSAGPLREGKGTTFDGGTREPTIMWWPGTIPAGTVCKTPAMTIDVLPTIAQLIGAPLPERKIDGKSIWPLIKGEPGAKSPHEAYYYYWNNGLQAVRMGQWKLHFPHPYRTLNGRPGGTDGRPGRLEEAEIGLSLFDLENDIGETKDVKDQHPEIVAQISKLADQMRADLGDAFQKQEGSGRRRPGRLLPGDARFVDKDGLQTYVPAKRPG